MRDRPESLISRSLRRFFLSKSTLLVVAAPTILAMYRRLYLSAVFRLV